MFNGTLPRRGEIWMADIRRPDGESTGSALYYDKHPYLIVSNNKWSKSSMCFNVLAITSSRYGRPSPVHVQLPLGSVDGLRKNSTILCENMTTLTLSQLSYKIGELPMKFRKQVAVAQVVQMPDLVMAFYSGVENTKIFREVSSF